MKSQRSAALLSVFLFGCSLTQPTITPRSVAMTGTTSAGLGLRVHLLVNNPNRVALTVQSIDARVTMAGVDLGRSSVANATRLPSRESIGIDADLTATWNDLPRLLVSTAMTENVPYHLDGTVTLGSSDVHLTVPFQVDSTLPRQILVDAGRNALPGASQNPVQGGSPGGFPSQLPTQVQGLPSVP